MAELSEPPRYTSMAARPRLPYDTASQVGVGALVINSTRIGTTAVLTVSGEIDLSTAPQLNRALRDILSDGFEIVALDLGGVSFIDSSGLQALITAYERQLGDRLRILPCKRLLRLIEITGMRSRLPVLAI